MIATYLLREDFEELGVGEEYAEGVIDELRSVNGRRARDDRPRAARFPTARRAASRCARRATRSTSPRSRGSETAAATSARPGSRATETVEEIIEFVRSEFAHAAARRLSRAA